MVGERMIEFKNVSKLYKEKAALRNINMTIECGEFLFSSARAAAVKQRRSR